MGFLDNKLFKLFTENNSEKQNPEPKGIEYDQLGKKAAIELAQKKFNERVEEKNSVKPDKYGFRVIKN